jgi:hypothetical protein
MCSKKKNKGHHDIYEENRFSDGKHYNKKHNNTDKKSRNNAKQDLRKMFNY